MKAKLQMVSFVLILGALLTSALVVVDDFTTPLIEKNERVKLQLSILGALNFEATKENVQEIFDKNITTLEKSGKNIYSTTNGDVAFQIEGPGLWGPILGIVALLPDIKTVKGITILKQEETPGLGSRIAEKEYLDTFKGKKLLPRIEVVGAGKGGGENQVEAITGATLSSKAFEAILNAEVPQNVALIEEGKR